ncbi:MAG: glycosyltransferase family 2 protein [Cyanobacteria bacterium J06581_3]
MPLSTPVVFLIFRRPDLTARVFELIRKAQPTKLLIVADGPKDEKESLLCQQARSIAENVDWDCEILRNYSDVNLGCRKRISSGLDWAFDNVEEAIILEDDCLPDVSFFQFCQSLLKRYRCDERIMMVSGSNFQLENEKIKDSYYYSKYMHVWGWATWRRAWKHYDVEMNSWQTFKEKELLNSVCRDLCEVEYWLNIFDKVADGTINSWAYQWVYACWQQSGMSVVPSVNLISNIGFRDDATHTSSQESPLASRATSEICDISHPAFVVNNIEADNYSFDHIFGGKKMKFEKTRIGKTIRLLRDFKAILSKKYRSYHDAVL